MPRAEMCRSVNISFAIMLKSRFTIANCAFLPVESEKKRKNGGGELDVHFVKLVLSARRHCSFSVQPLKNPSL